MIDFMKTLVTDAGQVFSQQQLTQRKEKKGVGNWVTEADVAIEKFIVDGIRAKFPTDFILAEESALESIPETSGRFWLVDPLDGTTNAIFDIPFYGISVALMENDQVMAGVVLDLPRQRLYWVEKGNGAFVDNKKMSVRQASLKSGLLCTGIPYARENFERVHLLMEKLYDLGARFDVTGSAVLGAALVAEGRYTLYYEVGLKPWDVAAASLLVEEAGGRVRSFDGKLNVLHPQTFVCGGEKAVAEFLALV